MPDRRFDVASTVDYVEDSYVISLHAVNYNVAASIDTPQTFCGRHHGGGQGLDVLIAEETCQ